MSKLPVSVTLHVSDSYHLKPTVKPRLYYFGVAKESVFSPSVLPPCPLAPSQAVCVACGLDSCPRTIQCGRTRPPSVLFFPHSSARPSARLKERPRLKSQTAVGGKRPPPPDPAVWLADPELSGGPRHLRQHKLPNDNAIKGMLYIPHVVLRHKLDGDARRWLRWIIPPHRRAIWKFRSHAECKYFALQNCSRKATDG